VKGSPWLPILSGPEPKNNPKLSEETRTPVPAAPPPGSALYSGSDKRRRWRPHRVRQLLRYQRREIALALMSSTRRLFVPGKLDHEPHGMVRICGYREVTLSSCSLASEHRGARLRAAGIS
jgi:hypothetical protein